MKPLIPLLLCALQIVPVAAIAQDVVVMRRSVAVPRPRPTPTATPTPAPIPVTCGAVVDGRASSGPTIAQLGTGTKAQAPAMCAAYATANAVASGVCVYTVATGGVSLNQGTVIGTYPPYSSSACSR